MKTRLSLALGLLIAVTPASVAAQVEDSPLPEAVDVALVAQLCAATTDDAAELDACAVAVQSAIEALAQSVPAEERSLRDQMADAVDDTLEDISQIDIDAALDDVIESARGFELDIDIDVKDAIDEAATAIEELDLDVDVDIQAAIDEAVAEALAATEEIDLQAAVDEALAEAQAAIDEADLQGTVDQAVGEAVAAVESSVDDAQAMVAEAQAWAQENQEVVCQGGSIGLGATVGIAVFVVTGFEWLGLQAFRATEGLTDAACSDVISE